MPACEYKPALMKHRVTLQSVTRASDGQGGWTDTWADEASLWAQIQPLNGWERMQAQQIQTPVTHKLLIRYRSGVTTAKRLAYGSRIFHIKEVLNVDEQSRFLQLRCIETVIAAASPGPWEEQTTNWENQNNTWESTPP